LRSLSCTVAGAQAPREESTPENAMRTLCAAILTATLFLGGFGDSARADTPPSKHQLMKDCMAEQRAAGRPKDEVKDACKDVTKTEKENADAQKKAEQPAKP
jgi:hypothetical protein